MSTRDDDSARVPVIFSHRAVAHTRGDATRGDGEKEGIARIAMLGAFFFFFSSAERSILQK